MTKQLTVQSLQIFQIKTSKQWLINYSDISYEIKAQPTYMNS